VTPEQLAQLFHETYERLAPEHGYETRKASAVPWADVPDNNKALMIAVAEQVGAAHEAIVRAKVAEEARTVIRSQAATGVPLGALASLSYFAAKLDESVGDLRGGQ